ncbi:MAG: MMPL family transporter [Actinomycetes bacterium]
MGRVSRWAVRRPGWAILVWVVTAVIIGFGASRFGGSYNDSFDLPNTDSSRAQTILAQEFGDQANNASAEIVFSAASGGPVTEVQPQVEALLAQVSAINGIAAVTSPYSKEGAAKGLVSQSGTVAKADVTFDVPAEKVDIASVKALVDAVESASSDTLTVGVGGQVIDFAGTAPPKTELLGVGVALVILLLMFGSLVGAGMPILTAILGLFVGLSVVTIAARFLDIATFGPTLATMIGLGVGIDYSLFVINRYRQASDVGRDPKEAALEAVNTAGRAVVFAGTTVIIALMGLFVLRINFMNGLAVGASLTVLTVMLTAVTLLPAVISALGHRVFAWRMPWARKRQPHPEGKILARYGLELQKRPWLFGGIALLFMVAMASPVLGIHQGFPDASGKAPDNTQRIAYDLTSEGFGPGANGPLIVVAKLPTNGDLAGASALTQALGGDAGVAFASPPQPTASGDYAVIYVQPKSGPQEAATGQTLQRLRSDVIPAATASTGVVAYVGGQTAIIEDFSQLLVDALPLFLLVVVGLGFLTLLVLFRSVLVPLVGVLASLLSFGAALGATVAVFQWGHLASLFGVTGTGPILPFLPVMLFAILFGLSMDYQIFLVSRMQEEWTRTHENRTSVRRGLAGSGRVVAAAAAIMASVFVSFVFGDDNTIKMFGLSLSVAVLLDAFVVRLVLVPSLLTVIGTANWWLPGWLGRLLPAVHIETESEAAEIADVDLEELPA